jgi:hypothetical protein
VSGPRAGLYLHNLPWGVARAWEGAEGRRRRGSPKLAAAAAVDRRRRGLVWRRSGGDEGGAGKGEVRPGGAGWRGVEFGLLAAELRRREQQKSGHTLTVQPLARGDDVARQVGERDAMGWRKQPSGQLHARHARAACASGRRVAARRPRLAWAWCTVKQRGGQPTVTTWSTTEAPRHPYAGNRAAQHVAARKTSARALWR